MLLLLTLVIQHILDDDDDDGDDDERVSERAVSDKLSQISSLTFSKFSSFLRSFFFLYFVRT